MTLHWSVIGCSGQKAHPHPDKQHLKKKSTENRSHQKRPTDIDLLRFITTNVYC